MTLDGTFSERADILTSIKVLSCLHKLLFFYYLKKTFDVKALTFKLKLEIIDSYEINNKK